MDLGESSVQHTVITLGPNERLGLCTDIGCDIINARTGFSARFVPGNFSLAQREAIVNATASQAPGEPGAFERFILGVSGQSVLDRPGDFAGAFGARLNERLESAVTNVPNPTKLIKTVVIIGAVGLAIGIAARIFVIG